MELIPETMYKIRVPAGVLGTGSVAQERQGKYRPARTLPGGIEKPDSFLVGGTYVPVTSVLVIGVAQLEAETPKAEPNYSENSLGSDIQRSHRFEMGRLYR
jgi:hypothetical protein